jgi:hypothetical protein
VYSFDESRAWEGQKAEAINQLAGENILTAGSHSYARIERLLRLIVWEKNSVNRFNAARIFGDIYRKL